ncbi:putative quinol monooxygenase [Mucilaginibacter koreensis]
MGIKLIALLQGKADAEETIELELQRLVEASAKEEGCLQYELYKDGSKRCAYVIVEDWASEEALQNHNEASHHKYFKRIAPVLLEKPAELLFLNRLA